MDNPNIYLKFHEIPQEQDAYKRKIKDQHLKELYSQFNFYYYDQNHETEKIKPFVYDLLNNHKFITLNVLPPQKKTKESLKLCNAVFCFEKTCLIVESIKINSLNSIILKAKSEIIDLRLLQNNEEMLEEINSFLSAFSKEIENNPFLQLTIKAIAAYIIRRHFYPSNYFKDQSFFLFNQKDNKKNSEDIDFSIFDREKLFQKVKNDRSEMTDPIHLNDFEENDFIRIRFLHSNDYSTFYLVIHKESFHLFMMKLIENNDIKNEKSIKHEIEFCEKYSHRCMVHFYGFVKKNKEKIGFIYEFMSKGTLEQFLKTNQIDEYFQMTTVFRLFQAIYYLHSNSLINRDIKPFNILVDHNNIPYLSDFDTIKKIDSTEKMTDDLGSPAYIPTEQLGENYSFPADIYSFGLIIYFIFEKKNINDIPGYKNDHYLDKSKVKNFLENPNFPNICKCIFEKCSQYLPQNRPNINEIKDLIIEYLNAFYYLDPKFLLKIEEISKVVQFYTEIYHLLFTTEDVTNDFLERKKLQLFQLLNLSNRTEISKIIYLVGKYYLEGSFENRDYQKAKEYFDIACQLKNYDAISSQGQFYYLGIIVEQSFQKAKEYFELGCEHNNPIAQNSLGILYMNGYGVERNYKKAKELFELSAQQNHGNAFVNIGCLYYMGFGVEQNFLKAIEYFETAAKMTNSEKAFNNLGNMYLKGSGVQIDYEKAKYFLEKAAKQNCSIAQYNLGNMYYKALGVVQDYSRAIHLYELSASQNCAFAIYKLGKIYLNGRGIKINYKKAKEYFELATKNNYDKGFYQLGLMYKNGQGVEQNYDIAKKYFDKSANSFNSDAFYQIGTLYYYGYLDKQDLIKAKDFFENASQMNNLNASFYLGSLYENGDENGNNINIQKAIEYYEICAQNKKSSYISKTNANTNVFEFEEKSLYNNHYYQSNNNLGLIYITEKRFFDIEKAEKYLKEAGFNEYPIGQNNIGLYV